MLTAIHPDDLESSIEDKLDAQAEDGSHTISDGELNNLPAPDYATPAADPVPALSPDQLRYQHYQEIIAESLKVEEARCDYETANAETKHLKKEFEGRQALFLRLTRRDPLQRQLAMVDPNLEATNGDEPLPVNDEWRKLPISVLGATEKKNEKLANGRLNTLGELQDFWTAGKALSDLDGIGETTDAEYRDRFAEYGTDHPEVFGEQAKSDCEIDPDEPEAE